MGTIKSEVANLQPGTETAPTEKKEESKPSSNTAENDGLGGLGAMFKDFDRIASEQGNKGGNQ